MIKCSACNTVTNDTLIKLSEPRSQSAIFENASKETYFKIRFDGCIVTQQTAADWLLVKPDDGTVVVELKGCDVEHAVAQIVASLRHIRGEKGTGSRRAGLIVCSRYPRIDTKIQRLKQAIAKEFRAPLHVRSSQNRITYEVAISF